MILTTYLRHPDDDPGIRGIQNLVGMSDAMSRKIMESVYSGDIPLDELAIDDFVKPLEQAIELVPCPRKFEFSNYIFDSDINPETGRVKFIEPCVERRKKCKHCKYYKNITICEFYAKDNKDYEVLEDCENYEDYEVNWELGIPAEKLAGKRIIFATAGSQVQDYKDKARRWFQEMILMMDLQGMQDYHLVISVGSDLIKENWTLPSNVTRFSWVPQLSVLAKSAAAYIHGGLATVKECIYMGVPFVILSLGKDQMDNALRVRRLGIGAVSFAESVSFSELQNLFLHATTNAWTKTKLEKMKFIFEQMELVRPGVRLIDNYLNELNTQA